MAHSTPVNTILEKKGRDTYSLPPDAMVYEAVKLMAENSVGSVLIKNCEELVGIFGERDYARKIVLRGRLSKETAIREVMSSPVQFVHADCTVDQAMSIMTELRIRHLPVLENGTVVGVVSIGDLVRWIVDEQAAEIGHLHAYITGQYPG